MPRPTWNQGHTRSRLTNTLRARAQGGIREQAGDGKEQRTEGKKIICQSVSLSESNDDACIGCGAMVPASDGAVHRYMESSPGCWAMFGEVLAREYSDLAYARTHRLTVDSYAVQHPGQPSPQSIQSVALHLISLCLVLEHEVSMPRATEAVQKGAKYKSSFVWLDPPPMRGAITVADVHAAKNAEEHVQLVWLWAKASWTAWSAHHQRIQAWLQRLHLLIPRP